MSSRAFWTRTNSWWSFKEKAFSMKLCQPLQLNLVFEMESKMPPSPPTLWLDPFLGKTSLIQFMPPTRGVGDPGRVYSVPFAK